MTRLEGWIRPIRLNGSIALVPSENSGGPLQAKTVYPSHSDQTVTPDEDYYGLAAVKVLAVPRIPACETNVREGADGTFETAVNLAVETSVTDKEPPTYQYYRWTTTDFRRAGATCIHANLGELALYDFGGNNVALNDGTQEYTASSTYATSSETKAFDGSTTTFWETDYANQPNTTNWMQVKFPTAVQIQKIGIKQQTAFTLDDAAYSFYVSGSNDGEHWAVIKEFTGVTGWSQGTEKQFSLIW